VWVVDGEVARAFELFEELGARSIDRWLRELEERVVVADAGGLSVAFIPADDRAVEEVGGYEVRVEHALSRILQLKLEDRYDYAVIVVMEGGAPTRVSISSPKHRDADVIASKLGGGGHPHVAGAPMRARDFREAMRKILRILTSSK